MNIHRLNEEAQKQLFDTITTKISESGPDDISHFLEILVDELDSIDQDDAFGTEGWKHHFGVED